MSTEKNLQQGRVVWAAGGFYTVLVGAEEVTCRIRGRLKQQAGGVFTGDLVQIERFGSKDGVMRDCHYNCNAWVWTGFVDESDGSTYAERLDKVRAQQLAGADCFIVEKTTNEVLYTNFVYGCNRGFILRDGADFFMMVNAVDGGVTTMQVEDIVTGKTTWMISNQLCSISKEGEATYVHVTEKFAGDINIVQTTGFAAPPYAGIFEGSGTVRLVNYYASDNMDGIKITVKNSQVVGCYLRDPNPANDIRVEGNGVKSLLFGNLFDKKKNPIISVGNGATITGGDS